uniref:CipC1 protein n=1 Tax=Paxillus involutus TaxID=71150 RepID=Q5V8L4_PAXIN|nr:CipC1 protein [Paxillus involutus]
MGWFNDDSEQANYHDQLTNDKHQGNFTHDLLAGAIAYEATKAYEDHLTKKGKPDSHAKAKELLAAFVATAGTQLVETKGRDAYDSYQQRKAQTEATEHLYELSGQDYQ